MQGIKAKRAVSVLVRQVESNITADGTVKSTAQDGLSSVPSSGGIGIPWGEPSGADPWSH